MAFFKGDDPEAEEKMRRMLGPAHVDQGIRNAIQACWMMLPKNKKTVDELEKQIHRLVDRAIKDFRRDLGAFGMEGPKEK
jgi:hypothetical protein